MSTLILIDHGSRRGEANALSEQLRKSVAQALAARGLSFASVRLAHLEAASPSLPEVIDASVADGASQIFVQPLFLFPGRHALVDIPQLIETARARHPRVLLRLGEVIGADPDFVSLLMERFRRAGAAALGSTGSTPARPQGSSGPPSAEQRAGASQGGIGLPSVPGGLGTEEIELIRRVAARRGQSPSHLVRELVRPLLEQGAANDEPTEH